MKCPSCQYLDTEVKDSRIADGGITVKRRRICKKCKTRFTTLEKVHKKELVVIKRSGVVKQFDSDKILKSIDTATRKRPISEKQIKQMVDNIIQKIEQTREKEISTKKIGDLIMHELAKIDQVAYIRFASVYKEFRSAQDFAKLINDLQN